MDNQPNSTGSGVPPQPERTAEQLRTIQAAMMEELGIGRMDTLPLEDRGHRGFIPLVQPLHSQVPTNEAVAAWHNIEFDDVDEANEQLESIANGQLYRLRRGASSGPSHAPSSRGGHHSSDNTVRGGHGGNPARAHPARGSPARGSPVRGGPTRGGRGGHSGSTRGGRGGSSSGTGPRVMTSSSSPATYFNDARRGTNKHARVDKVIAMLRAAPRQAPQPENRPPTSSLFGSLADPQAFLNVMGVNPRAGNVPAPAPTSQPQQVQLSHGMTATPLPTQPAFSAIGEASGSTQATAPTSSEQTPPTIGEVPALTQAPTLVMARAGTGISSSRWATPAAALSSGTLSFSTTSVTNTEASVASTPTAAASTPAAPMSNPAPVLNSSSHASSPGAAPVASASPSVSKSAISVPAIIGGSSGSAAGTVTSSQNPISNISAEVYSPIAGVARTSISSPKIYGSEASSNSKASQNSRTGRLVLMEKPAKANRNGGREVQGKVRLVKTLDSIVIEFEALNVIRLTQALSENVSFSTFAFTNITFTIGSDIVNFKLRFPHEASAFEQLLPAQLKRISTPSDHVVLKASACAVEAPAAILKGSERVIDSEAPVIEACTQVEPPTADLNISETVSALSVPDVETFTPTVSRSVPDIAAYLSGSPAAISDPYNLDNLPVSNASGTENHALLIDFSQEASANVSPLPEGGSAFDDLVCMNNDFMVAGVIEMLNRAAGGPFFKSNQDMSAQELLSLVEDLTMAWLKCSRSFRKFPPVTALAYVKEISKQAFEWARAADPEFQTNETEPILRADNISSKFNDLSLGCYEASIFGNNHSQQVGESQLGDEPQEVNYTQSMNNRQKVCKYSIQELVGLRNRALTIDHKLPQPPLNTFPPPLCYPRSRASTAGKPSQQAVSPAESTHDSIQPPPRPSRDEIASKFANPEYQIMFQNQNSSDLKPAISNVATSASTPQKPQPLSQVTSEVGTSSDNQYSQSDPALYGSILSAIEQDKPSTVQSKSKHHPADSIHLTRLRSAFSDLKIEASYQPPTVASSSPDPAVRQAEQILTTSKSTQQIGLTASAPPFTPFQKASQAAHEVGQNGSNSLSDKQKKILETSNKKEDMERASVPGLASSRWSSASSSVPRAVPSFPPQQYSASPSSHAMPLVPPQQYAPVVRTILIPDVNNPGSMQTISGMEVIGQVPIVRHQPVSPYYQEISAFQGFPPPMFPPPTRQQNLDSPIFPPCPNMFAHRTSNASSTASDAKFDKYAPASPADTPRPPLSPRKANIQANFKETIHRSFADRRN